MTTKFKTAKSKYTCRNCNGKQSSKYIKAMIKAGFGLCHLACKHCGKQTIVSADLS